MSSRTIGLTAVFAASAAALSPLIPLAAPIAMAAPASCQLSVVKTVKAGVGGEADTVGYDQGNGQIYVAGRGGVQAINGQTYKQTAVIKTGTAPGAVAVNPATDTVYVVNSTSGTLSVINGKTNKLTATVHVARIPDNVDVDQRTGKVYVTSYSGDISIVSARTNRVVGTISLGDNLEDAALNQVTGLLYVTNDSFPGDPGTIFVVNVSTRKVVARIRPGGDSRPADLAVNPRTNTIYVSDNPNPAPDGVFVINGASNHITTEISTGFGPGSLAVNPSSNLLYVVSAAQEDDGVLEIDGRDNQIIGTQLVDASDVIFIGENTPASLIYVTSEAGELFALNGCRP